VGRLGIEPRTKDSRTVVVVVCVPSGDRVHGARRFDLAKRTAESAAHALGRLIDAGEPEAIALRGALYHQLAVASARTNDGEQAYAYLDRAREAAAQLGGSSPDHLTRTFST
jgi:hypothetical protein